jgi:hypothetical protein
MERFACGYCGAEMLVQRRGGTIALKALTEAITRVQVGTDRTAAELALIRLEKELGQLRTKRSEMAARLPRDGELGWSTGCIGILGAIVVGVLLVASSASPNTIPPLLPLGAAGVSISLAFLAYHFESKRIGEHRESVRQELVGMDEQVNLLLQEMDQNRKIIEGR